MRNQIRISLSPKLHEHLQQKAEEIGLNMAAYVKNLIIQDMKGTNKPIYQHPLPIDKSVLKKPSYKGYTLIDG